MEAAELKWNEPVQFVDNILDLRPGVLTVIVGTVFKEQNKKPDVFKDLTGVIKTGFQAADLSFGLRGIDGDQNLAGKFVSEDD